MLCSKPRGPLAVLLGVCYCCSFLSLVFSKVLIRRNKKKNFFEGTVNLIKAYWEANSVAEKVWVFRVRKIWDELQLCLSDMELSLS